MVHRGRRPALYPRRVEALADTHEGLNPPQREAVEYGDGPLLVVAGAGSGKTRVLTHRIAHLLETGRARPGEILAITFTNRAAREMLERVEGLVGRRSRAMWVTTFHSSCARMLRADAERLGYSKSFTIYDEADSLRMVKRVMEELEIDTKRFPARAVRSAISGAKNELVDSIAYAERQGSWFEEQVSRVYELYEKRMLENNAMDFDDLLVRTVNVMELFEEARERWRRTFRHVLVDEYQDTNHAQYRLLQLLCAGHRNLTVVGDEDQSIYGFRHADIRNILDFEKDFPDAKVIKLEQNYRSTQTILSAANAVVENNRDRRPKELWTEAGDGEEIEAVRLADEHEEARWVAGEVERLCDDEGISPDRIAVFYRTNSMSRVLEDTLVRFDRAYQVIGGTRFYDRAEIKDAIAYLQYLNNPADTVAFSRIVNTPRRGIGNTSHAGKGVTALCFSDYQAPEEFREFVQVAPGKALLSQSTHGYQGHADVYSWKTATSILSSANNFRVGERGFQEDPFHMLFSATEQIFVSHPGEHAVFGHARPSYWAGNGTLPRVNQYKSFASLVYNLDPEHGVQFTHIYLPVMEFASWKQEGNWIFVEAHNGGYGAVYSSVKPEMQTYGPNKDREFICRGGKALFLARVGSKTTHGSFEDFISAILASPLETTGSSYTFTDKTLGVLTGAWDKSLKVDGKAVEYKGFDPSGENIWESEL